MNRIAYFWNLEILGNSMSDLYAEIQNLIKKINKELFENIVPFWLANTRDTVNGGFFGRITNDLSIEKQAQKSIILHSRTLWAFSFLYRYKPQLEYLEMANWAYLFIINHFIDRQYGGVYWMVDYQGNVIEDHKKMYGQAFSIYAFAEFYKITKNPEVLERAKEIFHLIETNNFDHVNTGYYEASSRKWQVDKTIPLSEEDLMEVKSMNTHLHLMEAYTNLYSVWKDDHLKEKLCSLIQNHIDYIIDPHTRHLRLFFGENWETKSSSVSFGHNIEASWLLCEAADELGDKELSLKAQEIAVAMVDVTFKEGFDDKNAIMCERDAGGMLKTHLDWWQQVEALVGFINSFQISKNQKYIQRAIDTWDIIEKYLVDKKNGEWFYAVDSDGHYDKKRYKVSEWKGPYHSIRGCVEALTRLENIYKQKAK